VSKWCRTGGASVVVVVYLLEDHKTSTSDVTAVRSLQHNVSIFVLPTKYANTIMK